MLPCPEFPAEKPEGGWFWYDMENSRYKCPNGLMFADGNYPYWYSNCTPAKVWDPEEVEVCIRKFFQLIWPHSFFKVSKSYHLSVFIVFHNFWQFSLDVEVSQIFLTWHRSVSNSWLGSFIVFMTYFPRDKFCDTYQDKFSVPTMIF